MPIPQEERSYVGQHYTLRRNFDEKQKVGETLFQEGAPNSNDMSSPKHSDKGEGQLMMASQRKMENKKYEQQVPEGEPELDRMDQRSTCSKLKFICNHT